MSAGRPCVGLKRLLEDTTRLADVRELQPADLAAHMSDLVVRWYMAVPLISDLIAMQRTSAGLQQLVRERVESERAAFEQRRRLLGPRTGALDATFLEGVVTGLESAASIASSQLVTYNRRIPDLPLS